MSFSQEISGLNAASANLEVIGNNIANAATAGFKSSSIAFTDMYASSKVGMGVKVAGVIQNFNDGTVTSTSRELDVALSGQGFFRLVDASGSVCYSRNGQFSLDENRNLVNMQGMKVTGYPASGTPLTLQTGADPTVLNIPTTQMKAKATTTGSLVANLNSSDSAPVVTPFDKTSSDSYNAKNSMSTYDSLGNAHTIDLYFVKSSTADNQWTVWPIDASTGRESAPLNLTFNTHGELTSNASYTLRMGALNGASAQEFQISFLNSMQQNTGANTFGNPLQDGYRPGELTSYQINDDGTIIGNYSNEKKQPLGQMILADFANKEGLKSEGNNLWSESGSSGQPRVGLANTGTFGSLTAGALESSNVNLGEQLVNMIPAQRAFQGCSQSIKTKDANLNTLVNLR